MPGAPQAMWQLALHQSFLGRVVLGASGRARFMSAPLASWWPWAWGSSSSRASRARSPFCRRGQLPNRPCGRVCVLPAFLPGLCAERLSASSNVMLAALASDDLASNSAIAALIFGELLFAVVDRHAGCPCAYHTAQVQLAPEPSDGKSACLVLHRSATALHSAGHC
jgi:hypothetical protein